MTKLSLLAVVPMLAVVAVPALAYTGHHRSTGVTVRNNAEILNVSGAASNTGLNSGGSSLRTGTAGADSLAGVDGVNATDANTRGTARVVNNAEIANVSVALANTGMNETRSSSHHHSRGGSSMVTGAATSVSTATVENVNVTGF